MSPLLKSCHLVAALLMVALAIPASANSPKRPSAFDYDKAHEITFQATIQKVTSKPADAGHEFVSLTVAGGGTTREVVLGAFLTKDVRALLVERKPIQLVGAVQTFKGRQTLMVRAFVVDGRSVEVRNEHGFFLRPNQMPLELHHPAPANVPAQGKVQHGDQQ